MRLEYRIARNFLPKIEFHPDGCWLWRGQKNAKGYGKFSAWISPGYKGWIAHRLSYQLFIGPIPEGMTLDHECDVKACVNPLHLRPMTALENRLRGRFPLRERTHCLHGHEFTPDNTRLYRGARICRTCHREYMREYDKVAS